MGNVQCSWGGVGEVYHKYECSSSDGSSCTEETTSYAHVAANNGFGSSTYNASMTITDPLGNIETHLFSTTSPMRTNPEETDVQNYDPSGTMIRGVHKTYSPITAAPGGGYLFDFVFPTQVTTTLYDVSPSISTSTNYTYETYSLLMPGYSTGVIDNATEIDTKDYDGTVIKKVAQQWEPSSAFTSSPLIVNRLQSRTTTDAAGSVSATITYVFSSVQGSSRPPRESYWRSYRLFL